MKHFTKKLSKKKTNNNCFAKRKRLFLKNRKKRNYSPIDSPYNSNEFLIKNHSSPFFDEDDEGDFGISFMDNNYTLSNDIDFKETEFNSENKMDSTNDESDIINNLEDNLYLQKKEEIYINKVN